MIMRIEGLQKHYSRSGGIFAARRDVVKANEDVSSKAHEGRTVALVGESGCGKSTLAKVLTGLETATNGSVRFAGTDIAGTEGAAARS